VRLGDRARGYPARRDGRRAALRLGRRSGLASVAVDFRRLTAGMRPATDVGAGHGGRRRGR
jgi:hypothetical protein